MWWYFLIIGLIGVVFILWLLVALKQSLPQERSPAESPRTQTPPPRSPEI